MKRDPRLQPKGGDYLRRDGNNWLVVGSHNDGTLIEYRDGPDFYRNSMEIEEWASKMDAATILHAEGVSDAD